MTRSLCLVQRTRIQTSPQFLAVVLLFHCHCRSVRAFILKRNTAPWNCVLIPAALSATRFCFTCEQFLSPKNLWFVTPTVLCPLFCTAPEVRCQPLPPPPILPPTPLFYTVTTSPVAFGWGSTTDSHQGRVVNTSRNTKIWSNFFFASGWMGGGRGGNPVYLTLWPVSLIPLLPWYWWLCVALVLPRVRWGSSGSWNSPGETQQL